MKVSGPKYKMAVKKHQMVAYHMYYLWSIIDYLRAFQSFFNLFLLLFIDLLHATG